MNGSIERVRAVVNGDAPDRTPLYDLLRNDAVIGHFAGEPLTLGNCREVVYRAYEPALDATRPSVRMPGKEKTITLPDGRSQRHFRWTIWTERHTYPDTAAYRAAKRKALDEADLCWSEEKQAGISSFLDGVAEQRRRLGEVFFVPGAPSLSLMGIAGEVGWEMLSYCLADCPGIVDELLELGALRSIAWVEHLPEGHGIECAFVGDDIAFKTAPFCSPRWFDEHYMPRLARVMDAYHAKGVKVLFHSDGNLNAILDGLVGAGIDGLNPIEVLAGMDPADIHRRFPALFMAGGIDVSQLLPFGTPAQVRDAVRRSIDAAEGRIMIGSSTELNNEVPLENYLALRDAVLGDG